MRVPEGRLSRLTTQSSLRGLALLVIHLNPGTEVPGYFQSVPRGTEFGRAPEVGSSVGVSPVFLERSSYKRNPFQYRAKGCGDYSTGSGGAVREYSVNADFSVPHSRSSSLIACPAASLVPSFERQNCSTRRAASFAGSAPR